MYVNFWKRNILYIFALSPMANFKIFSNCQAALKLEFQFACSYGKGGGGGGGIYTKKTNISFNSNVSITGVHDKKISCKTYFLVFIFFSCPLNGKKLAIVHAKKLPKMNRAKTAKSLPVVLGISTLK